MKKYIYRTGEEVKENDICFYSEDDGSHEWHYADSINLIVEHKGVLKTKAFVITDIDGNYIDYDEPEENMVELQWGQNFFKKDGVLYCMTKIGTYPENAYMLTKKYANKNFKNEQL